MDASKERISQSANQPETKVRQKAEMVDLKKDIELPVGVETWIKKVEKVQPQSAADDSSGQVVFSQTVTDPAAPLPVSRQTFASGFKKTIGDAGRWLSTFIFRVIKIKKGKVKFKGE